MAIEIKSPKPSLSNKTIVALFLAMTIWGICLISISQYILQRTLVDEGLDKTIISHICKQFTTIYTGFTMAALVIVLFIGWSLSKKITKMINKLTEGVMEVTRGNLDVQIDIPNCNEFGPLAASLKKMTEDLKSTTTSIDNLNKEIAERKQAEEKIIEQNEFLNLILESLKHPFYVIDTNDYTIKLANSMAQTGSLSKETTCYCLTHQKNTPCNDSENICPLEEIKKTKQPTTVEHIHYDKDSNRRDVEVHAYPVFDKQGNLTQIIEYCLDITERKQAELKQDQLIKKVDNINKELKEFASIVSHDLKAPLRGIKTLANWILSDSSDKLGDQANEQMNLLLDRVERMYNLIEGALQYSRVDQAEGKRIQVDLNNFVPEVINMVVPPKNIIVTIDNKLPTIECEEIHIMQIFQNLLSNAIKYMDKPQGRIQVGCVEEDDFWKFSVTDNGPGIEEKHFEKIFKMFHILHTSPDFEGTGVGLTVAMKIVKLYEGNIWVESKVGEGSTFFFTFPKQKIGLKNEKLETNTTR